MITPEKVTELKKNAKLLKEATGEKLTACLDEIAKKHGFEDWRHLMLKSFVSGYAAKRKEEQKMERYLKWVALGRPARGEK